MNLYREQFLHNIRTMISNELKNNNLSSLELFVVEVQFYAKIWLDGYINNTYKNNIVKLNDPNKLSTFLDFTTGYRSLMTQWIANHSININKSVDKKLYTKDYTNTIRYSGYSITIGTTAALYIGYFCSIPIGFLLEILAIGFTYKSYIKGMKRDNDLYQEKLFLIKKNYCEQIKNELMKWIDNAITYSENILREQYQINNYGKQ